jgi:hypothetical protein
VRSATITPEIKPRLGERQKDTDWDRDIDGAPVDRDQPQIGCSTAV